MWKRGGGTRAHVGEGRAEQVAADTLEALAVAAVDSGRGVQLHAVGGDRVRRRLGVRGDGGEMRASERVLDASPERRVEVEVVVVRGSGDGVVDSGEDGGHALLESAVGHEAVQVHVKAQVRAKALDDRDDAAVERRDRGEPAPSWRTPASLPALQRRDRRRQLSKYA